MAKNEILAEDRISGRVALVLLLRVVDGRDRLLDGDIVPVEREGEIGDKGGGEHHAARYGERDFRHQLGVAGIGDMDLEARTGDRGIAMRADAEQGPREQLVDERRADVLGNRAAQPYVVVDLAGEAELPGLHHAAGRVVGDAAGGIEVDRLDEAVPEDRHVDFEEAFVLVIMACPLGEVARGEGAGAAELERVALVASAARADTRNRWRPRYGRPAIPRAARPGSRSRTPTGSSTTSPGPRLRS